MVRDEHILRIDILKISLKSSSHCSIVKREKNRVTCSLRGEKKKTPNNKTVEMNVCLCHFHPGEEAINTENILRDNGVWSAIRPLAECHRTNDWERTLPLVDSIFLHHQYNICDMLCDFNMYTPSVLRTQYQLIWGMLYFYIYFDSPICSP